MKTNGQTRDSFAAASCTWMALLWMLKQLYLTAASQCFRLSSKLQLNSARTHCLLGHGAEERSPKGLLCPVDDAILGGLRKVDEVGAISGNPDYQVGVLARLCLGFVQ